MKQFTTTYIMSSSPLLRKREFVLSPYFPCPIKPHACSLAIDCPTIHTTIPIYEVSHDAPIIHQSQTHDAVPIEKQLLATRRIKHQDEMSGL